MTLRPPPLAIPISSFDDHRKSLSFNCSHPMLLHPLLDSIAETPEYEVAPLNLGAETPDSSILAIDDSGGMHGHLPTADPWAATSAFAAQPTTSRNAHLVHTLAFPRRNIRDLTLRKEIVDRDCGIWYVTSIVSSVLA
jgi:hypothetical protein